MKVYFEPTLAQHENNPHRISLRWPTLTMESSVWHGVS